MKMISKKNPEPRNQEPAKASERPHRQSNRRRARHHSLDSRVQPVLRFTPSAWAKLHFFCHHGGTEIGGFGVARANDLLAVEEFITVRQENTSVSVVFDDTAMADFFDDQVDTGRKPQQFARIWLHTHPGESPAPSEIDEDTFDRVFGGCEWAVMFILARDGSSYARLRFNVGPGGEMCIPVQVDYAMPFTASDHDAWREEYDRNIHPVHHVRHERHRGLGSAGGLLDVEPEELDVPICGDDSTWPWDADGSEPAADSFAAEEEIWP